MNSHTTITGSGSFIPATVKCNRDFITQEFYAEDNERLKTEPQIIVDKFLSITGIAERRYADKNMTASSMGIIAAKRAIADANTDPETIDYIIAAHNFGNVCATSTQSDAVPSIASHIKHGLGIKNPNCIPYDILFGCPGWLQGVIQADAFCKAGIAKKILVVGTETLSRVIDKFDRDSMIFSDGAGAVVLESKATNAGIIGASAQSFTLEELNYINMGPSYAPDAEHGTIYIKMQGRKVYEFALKQVPLAMKACVDASNISITDIKKIFIHQANEKMDEAIIKAFYKLYELPAPENIMPMNIHMLGNSSVATIPTLYDMVCKGELPEHALHAGDIILFASVGAGMNINAVCYRV
ncbi:MAG: ketoacyl-ACP synthase III [Filimonas sp.]|nr:ketoacyl-ACP synthase III [Filimonas sp.]